MIKINTDRLIIFPLDKFNLELCISNFGDMERSVGLSVSNKKINFREEKVYKLRLRNIENNSNDFK